MSPLLLLLAALSPQPVTFRSLLSEMSDRAALARYPDYQSLEATSYNRESVRRDKPGWFADSDGTGFIRTETIAGKTEYVIMEHNGPGCITKMWTPFFYYDYNNRVGPNVRIYLDGSDKPVIDESLIKLVTGKGSLPLCFYTARAGDCYLPIPFAKSCKVTMTDKPFYNSINYRAYPAGTPVETLSPAAIADIGATERALRPEDVYTAEAESEIEPGSEVRMEFLKGPSALGGFQLRIPGSKAHPELLRSVVLEMRFDGEETVWCPVGDFFSCPDSIHPYRTFQRGVAADGTFTCNWIMPYRNSVQVRLINLSKRKVATSFKSRSVPWHWDNRSMHFHANWRPDDIVPGTPFQDWNYIDIKGKGVYVGDSWMVLNMQKDTWWGEGDEKIYVDDAWDKGFPTHFGTGSEDYYGWAGGVLPTREDEFSIPFLANVRVGGLDGHTLGYNVNTRTRALDAIPFSTRLRFDMESSFGTDIRNPWNLLGYSAATFWYALPGATSNRPPQPAAAAKPVVTLADLERRSAQIKAKH